ncbi:hypothetical protein ACJRO7_022933 [Eucalyptus globulus]|uniref:Uncharacterized protein n=1 Tax=Eucalyptus globulus TaxID=34317 RepID=A0ABD3KD06_EUCGL
MSISCCMTSLQDAIPPGRIAQTHYLDVPVDGPTTRVSSIHGSEKLPSVDGVRGHRLQVCRVLQEDRERNSFLSPLRDDHSLQPRESLLTFKWMLTKEPIHLSVKKILLRCLTGQFCIILLTCVSRENARLKKPRSLGKLKLMKTEFLKH